MHSFDQNILSFESFYIIIRGGNFSLFLLHLFYLYFVLLAESLRFNHSTIHARVVVIFLILKKFFDFKKNFIEANLWLKNTSAQNLIVNEFL